ncbi:Uncharacterised protein [Actinobacillus suis]|nr:Uncharacterised protein [Actinobacillus suis]
MQEAEVDLSVFKVTLHTYNTSNKSLIRPN